MVTKHMLTKQQQKDFAKLHRRRERERQGVFLVEGLRSVEAALDAQAALDAVLVTKASATDARVEAVLRRAETAAVPVHRLPARDLARITTVTNGQGIAAVARRIVQPVEAVTNAKALLALDGVQDPGNVGTLLRTAAWFGLGGVLAGPGTADVESPKVVRSAMGGLWDLALAQTDDLAATLGAFRDDGWHLAAAYLDGTPAASWRPPERTVLVLGSEAHGVSDAVASLVHERVTIRGQANARSGVESLNVALAGGILRHRWQG
ncbi:MAG: RNA methyltransferase [Bacteroidota bacterium]